jgi:hypothetical protein
LVGLFSSGWEEGEEGEEEGEVIMMACQFQRKFQCIYRGWFIEYELLSCGHPQKYEIEVCIVFL